MGDRADEKGRDTGKDEEEEEERWKGETGNSRGAERRIGVWRWVEGEVERKVGCGGRLR